jgi:hypothetical protein
MSWLRRFPAFLSSLLPLTGLSLTGLSLTRPSGARAPVGERAPAGPDRDRPAVVGPAFASASVLVLGGLLVLGGCSGPRHTYAETRDVALRDYQARVKTIRDAQTDRCVARRVTLRARAKLHVNLPTTYVRARDANCDAVGAITWETLRFRQGSDYARLTADAEFRRQVHFWLEEACARAESY